jgi:chaperonin GroEL
VPVAAGKLLDTDEYNWGFEAQTGELKDLVRAGIIDPTKVVRTRCRMRPRSPVCW